MAKAGRKGGKRRSKRIARAELQLLARLDGERTNEMRIFSFPSSIIKPTYARFPQTDDKIEKKIL
jgi:hypothetical protein